MNAPQIILDMPEDQYRRHPYIANSDLRVVLTRSPAHAVVKREQPQQDTPAKRDGRALHVAILEPELFMQKYCVLPENAPRDLRHYRNAKKPSDETLQSCAWWDTWERENGGRITLDADDYRLKQEVADRIRNHPDLRGYFNAPGVSESSVFALDPATGTGVKARRDRVVVIGGHRVMLDPKSTDDCSRSKFAISATTYGYYQQAAFYKDISEWAGEPIDLPLLIAFEKEPPFAVKVYEISDDDLEYGRRQYRRALDTWAECMKNNEFPAYDTGIEVLTRPHWAQE